MVTIVLRGQLLGLLRGKSTFIPFPEESRKPCNGATPLSAYYFAGGEWSSAMLGPIAQGGA